MTISTKQRIKDVAFALVADKGYEATSIADIAAEVGVTKPALYAHFGGKEDLFLSIFADLEADYNNCKERLLKESEEMEVPENLYHLFEGYLLYFMRDLRKNAFWYRAMLFPPQALINEMPSRIRENEQDIFQHLKEIIQEGIARGVIRKASAENMCESFLRIREGFLVLATFDLLNKKLDERKYEAMIKATWDDYWLGIKEHRQQD